MDSAEEKQVTLRLTTQLPAKLRVSDKPLAVPARLTRYGLSEVVNSLLRHGERPVAARVTCRTEPPAPSLVETPIPFDFLLNDELLQSSLHSYLVSRGISAVRRARGPGGC